MKPLHVALFVKPSPATTRRDDRNMGYWSYSVPEFTWEHFAFQNGTADLGRFRDYDLIFHEDAGFCKYLNRQIGPPVVYLAIDSTLSDSHYAKRLDQARQADIVLVDHDKADRFRGVCKRVLPFPFCVNDRMFRPGMLKNLDIVNHCSSGSRAEMPGAKERSEMRAFLGEYTRQSGYSYKSGAVGLTEYAANMGDARVVVNWPRTSINRPHRAFDTMACRAALLTGTLPWVDGDLREDGVHHLSAEHWRDFPPLIERLLAGEWERIAEAGYRLVATRHTWAIRAQELREILAKELRL